MLYPTRMQKRRRGYFKPVINPTEQASTLLVLNSGHLCERLIALN